MNFKIKGYISLIFIVLLFNNVDAIWAQAQTAYEKKNEELLSQVRVKWGNKAVEQVNTAVEKLGYEKLLREIATFKVLYSMERAAGNKKYVESTTKRIDVEALFWYADEWGKIQKLMTNFDDAKISIKKEFLKWNQKGEFEKQADYELRLKNQSENMFVDICLKQIDEMMSVSNFNLLPYNSEKESFNIVFTCRSNNRSNTSEWQGIVNVPIDVAENFKNNFFDFRRQINYSEVKLCNYWLVPKAVTLLREDNNATVIEKYYVTTQLKNQTEVTIPFDGLGIDNPYLKGYVFKYSNAIDLAKQHGYEQNLEKQRLDSLELVALNNRLDSVFNDYNLQLIQNSFNVNKITLKDDFEATCGFCNHYYAYWRDERFPNPEEIEEKQKKCLQEFEYNRPYKFKYSSCQPIKNKDKNNFDEQIHSFEKKFKKLQKYFECEYWYNYYTTKVLFLEKNDFDSFYRQGKNIYDREVEKRNALYNLKKKSQLIQLMDFQKENNDPTNNNYATRPSEVLSIIKESQSKSYYSEIIDYIIKTNNGLNKEWNKNGQYFESKLEFYSAYISDNYKGIVKQKKKEKK